MFLQRANIKIEKVMCFFFFKIDLGLGGEIEEDSAGI